MLKKILVIIVFFYILALFQTSFLVHFNLLGWSPNLILIIVILLNLFEDPKKNDGILGALWGGFFLDIFSVQPIGFHILILMILAIFIKLILKKYVQPVILWKNILKIKK